MYCEGKGSTIYCVHFAYREKKMQLENYIVKTIDRFPKDALTGRRKIRTSANRITSENVREVVEEALGVHSANAAEIDYLYRVYCGEQDIRHKTKAVRENINNKVVINRANEIVTFKSAYLLDEPIQYISYKGDEETASKVDRLNEYMRSEDKDSKDKEIVDWIHICGVAPRLVLADKDVDIDEGAPFCVYTLDPRNAFVIYNCRIGEKPMAGVILQQDEKQNWFADVYTEDTHYLIKRDLMLSYKVNYNGIPLIEYVNNEARIGAFELVLPILNNINLLESNAVDSVEDFVNGFDVFQNCDIEDGDYSTLSIGGKAVKIKTATPGMEAKVYRVASEISQSGVQTRIDDLTESYLTICGMPNRNGGSSTSDTGQAVIYRDGWSEAESRAKDSEKLFTRSERNFLKIVLHICETLGSGKYSLDLKLSDIKTEFLRKNFSNLQSKTQILCEMLNNPKIHPLTAYETAGIAKDSLAAYRLGMEWYKDGINKQLAELDKELDNARETAIRVSRQNDKDAESQSGGIGREDEGRDTNS